MLFSCLTLAISSSIDSLGIGITYGLKNTKLTNSAKFILFIMAFIISIISIYFGNILKIFLPDYLVSFLGNIILIFMGFFIIFQAIKKSKKEIDTDFKNLKIKDSEQIYSFFIKCLGITIKIIKNPNYSYLDKSNSIDYKEALFLSLALSLDSFCVGIGFSFMNSFSFLFPIFISCFQFVFLNTGFYLGKKISKFSNIPNNVWSIISGFLLLMIGFCEILL